jgi:molybdopterin-guanine dinucleotide biosynthesis protein A
MMASVGTAGILLTGGRSRRLGVDKARMRIDGRTLADRAARLLGTVCQPVIELGPGVSDLPAYREAPPGSGPLAAVATGGEELRARGHHGPTIVLAVDLVQIDESLLRLVRDWPGAPTVVPSADGRLQPVCARYGADALVAARSLVDGGITSLMALFDVIEHDVMLDDVWRRVAPPDAFDDVDTPDDARRLGIDLTGLP